MVALHGLNLRLQGFQSVSPCEVASRRRAIFSRSSVLTLLLPNIAPTLSAMLVAAVVAASFSRSVCTSFFRPAQLVLCRLFLFHQFRYVGFQPVGHCLYFSIKLSCGNMSCFEPSIPRCSPNFAICFGIGVLVLFQLDARHHLVSAQPGTGHRFRAVAFGRPLLLLLAFPFGRYDRHECRVDMRRRFVQMQVGRYDILPLPNVAAR